MRKLIVLGLALISVVAYSQSEILDKEKYAACRLTISIDYKGMGKDYAEAKKHEGIEIVLICTLGKGKTKAIERGYIRNREKNGIRTVHFEPMESVKSPAMKIAKYPLFDNKNMYCHKAIHFSSVPASLKLLNADTTKR